MRTWMCGVLTAILAIGANPASASAEKIGPVTDCPLRGAAFSITSPMIDILLSPAARDVVDRDMPGVLTHLPPMMLATTAPSFAAIITLRELLGFGALAGPTRTTSQTEALLALVDADLRQLPVTTTDQVARCQRYDNERPHWVVGAGRPRLLVFEKINGFRDSPSVDAAHRAVLAIAAQQGWTVAVTDRGGAITPALLRRFDAVIWNNVSGDVLTLSQRSALQSFVERGGGFVGIHGSAGDPVTWWDWYVDTLIGARFKGHPFPNQFQSARVVIDNPADPLARGLPSAWTMKEEWYSFTNNPRSTGSHILATLDERTYQPLFMGKQDLHMGDHPIAWSRCIGAGRMFYSAIGHRPEMYADPNYVTMLTNAIAWAVQRKTSDCNGAH